MYVYFDMIFVFLLDSDLICQGAVHGMTVDPNTHTSVSNFNPHTSFLHPSHNVANYANSLLFIICTFSGYEQPFYVSIGICSEEVFATSLILRGLKGDERDQSAEEDLCQVDPHGGSTDIGYQFPRQHIIRTSPLLENARRTLTSL